MGIVDRRPLAVRQTRLARLLCRIAVGARLTANGVSVAGLVAGIAAGICFAATAWSPQFSDLAWASGGVLVLARGISNLVDGMVAEATGTASPLGAFLNEAPDRISDAAMLIGVGFAMGGDPALGLLASLCALLTAYARVLGGALGQPQSYAGPLDKTNRIYLIAILAFTMAFLPPSALNQISNGVGIGLPAMVLVVVVVGAGVTAVRRVFTLTRLLRCPK